MELHCVLDAARLKSCASRWKKVWILVGAFLTGAQERKGIILFSHKEEMNGRAKANGIRVNVLFLWNWTMKGSSELQVNLKDQAMNLQFITDTKGQVNAIQLPMKEWKQIQKDLEELERLRNKKVFMTELAEAVEEMKLIKAGKIEARNAEDFLNEL